MASDERRETIADIIAEKRNQATKIEISVWNPNQFQRELISDLRREADRLEAAWKRERAKIEADALAVGGIVESARQKPVGNAAAMREALEVCLDFIMRLDRAFNPFMQNLLENAIAKARAALAAPPRNCDAGTAENQARRFYAYYSIHNPPSYAACLAWAQMPYAAEEGGAQ